MLSPSSGAYPLTVTFSSLWASTYVGTKPRWLWTFGDGASSTEQNPTHTYTASGTYTVHWR